MYEYLALDGGKSFALAVAAMFVSEMDWRVSILLAFGWRLSLFFLFSK